MIPNPLNPAAWNRFSYVYGNPVNHTDPSGHCIEDLCIVETFLLGVAVGAVTNWTFNAIDHHICGTPYQSKDQLNDLLIGGAFGGLFALTGLALSPAGVAIFTGQELATVKAGLTVGQRFGLFAGRTVASGAVNALQGVYSRYFKSNQLGSLKDLGIDFAYGAVASVAADGVSSSANFIKTKVFNSRFWKSLTSGFEATTFTIRNPWSVPLLSTSFKSPKFDYAIPLIIGEIRPIYRPIGLVLLNQSELVVNQILLNSNILPLYPLYQER